MDDGLERFNNPKHIVLLWYAVFHRKRAAKGNVVASSFSRIADLAAEGSVRIIELQAVPRSMSTALGRCLNESGAASLLINEPFGERNGDLDVAAEYVVGAVERELSSAPLIVLTKNMARFLTAPVFEAWSEICSAVVWCIRDPRAQISSLVTRTANDLFFGIGSDRLKQSELQSKHLAAVTDLLQNSALSMDFARTGWRAIGARFSECGGRRPNFVADGSLLSRQPVRFLRYLCSRLGLDFRDRMVDGWERAYVNVNRLDYPELDDATDAWIKQAATSRGVECTESPPLADSALPDALRRHLLNEALPTYEMLIRAFYAQDGVAEYGLGNYARVMP